MSEELKPCPFCGHSSPTKVLDYREHRGHGVQCGNGKCKVSIGCNGETEAEAIAAWNTRHQHKGTDNAKN